MKPAGRFSGSRHCLWPQVDDDGRRTGRRDLCEDRMEDEGRNERERHRREEAGHGGLRLK